MPIAAEQGSEPIPGYRLIQRLGAGGFGEVWKSTAPGGLTKAIKIVYGQMNESRADQEIKALRRVKDVRHPFLLSLERFEVISSQLLIVMELADSSLLDRYLACKKEGMRGIPRNELLGYLRDAADALDYMSERFGLQHLDIKPQNLLLVAERIKIADFGQVKDLQSTSATATGGLTPVYAPPELFDARISRFCDQYSLAIVYQELLTGVRPFPGTTALQLASQHTNSPPLLDPLSRADRPVIGRALSKVSDKRFPTCRAMVDALLWASGGTSSFQLSLEGEVKQAKPTGPATVRTPRAQAGLPAGAHAGVQGSDFEFQLPDLSAREGAAGPAPVDESILKRITEAGDEEALVATPQEPSTNLVSRLRVPPRAPGGGIQLRPTLFLGVGGLAGRLLRRLKQRLRTVLGELRSAPILRVLYLDTDKKALQHARSEDSALPGTPLDDSELLLTPLRAPEDYREQSEELLRWLDRRWLYGIPRSLLTDHIRALGRLALVDNRSAVLERLRDVLQKLSSPEARKATADATDLSLRTEEPRVFLIASICGGTGGGMLLDLAFTVRQILTSLRLSDKGVCGMLLFVTDPRPAERELGRVNACATLMELLHAHQAGVPSSEFRVPSSDSELGTGNSELGTGSELMEECYLINLGDPLQESEADSATDLLAEYLSFDSTFGGAFLDSYRRDTHTEGGATREPVLRTFGLDRLMTPSHLLGHLVANRCCLQLVNTWRGNLAGGQEHVVSPPEEPTDKPPWWQELNERELVKQFWSARPLGPDPTWSFTKMLLGGEPAGHPAADAAAAGLGHGLLTVPQPEGALSGDRAPTRGTEEESPPPQQGQSAQAAEAQAGLPAGTAEGPRAHYQAALLQVDKLLGNGEETEAAGAGRPASRGAEERTELGAGRSALEEALSELSATTSEHLSDSILVWLLEQGANSRCDLSVADRAARGLLQRLQATTESVRARRAEATGQRGVLRPKLEEASASKGGGLISWLGIGGRQTSPNDLDQLFLAYCHSRWSEVALQCVLDVLGAVTGLVMEFIQETAGCRKKLANLAAAFGQQLSSLHGAAGSARRHTGTQEVLPNTTVLLPGHATDLTGASEALFKGLTPEMISKFKETIWTKVVQPHGGLWQLLTNKQYQAAALQEELCRRAWPTAVEALRGVDAATLFLESTGAHAGPARASGQVGGTPEAEAGLPAGAHAGVRDSGSSLEAARALRPHVQAAAPRLRVSESWVRLVAALPASPGGDMVKKLLSAAQSDLPMTLLESDGDVLLVQEAANLPLRAVVESVTRGEPAYLETARRVVTRIDVPWSF